MIYYLFLMKILPTNKINTFVNFLLEHYKASYLLSKYNYHKFLNELNKAVNVIKHLFFAFFVAPVSGLTKEFQCNYSSCDYPALQVSLIEQGEFYSLWTV